MIRDPYIGMPIIIGGTNSNMDNSSGHQGRPPNGGTGGMGSMQRPNGGVQRPEGGTQQPDGSIQLPNGDIQRPNGDVQRPNGDMQWSNGDMQRPNGDMQRPNGGFQRPEGSPQRPDGGMQRPNDTIIGGMVIDSLPVAMSYTPMQQWKTTYSQAEALNVGTVFPELNLPFLGGGRL